MEIEERSAPIRPAPKSQLTPMQIEKFIVNMRLPHVHTKDGRVVLARNRKERRDAGLRGKR